MMVISEGLIVSGGTVDSERASVVGALIVDDLHRAFVQRRSPDRRLFPGCWDVVGGAIEDGEEPLEALRREIREETGWELARVLHTFPLRAWEGSTTVEADYVVKVDGDLAAPRLEAGKHDEFAWVSGDQLGMLEDSARGSGSTFILDLVRDALALDAAVAGEATADAVGEQ